MGREPSSARRTVTSLATRAAEVSCEGVSVAASLRCLWLGRACRAHERFGLRPSFLRWDACSLALSLSFSYPSFVSHFCLSLSLFWPLTSFVSPSACCHGRTQTAAVDTYGDDDASSLATTTQRQRRGGRGGRTATRALRLRRTAGSLCWRLQRSGAPYLAVADLLLVE